jgi:TusA-related sulfurtransferase
MGDTENRRSIERFVRMRGHETISVTEEGDKFKLLLRKAEKEKGDIPTSTCGLK